MKIAKTTKDVNDLFADYEVEMQLTDGPDIYIQFPSTQEEKEIEKLSAGYPFDNFSHLSDENPVKFTRQTDYTIRTLLGNPRFTRLTTVAQQLGSFAMVNTDFGKIKIRKKANEPLTMIFEEHKLAKQFFHKIRKIGNWKEAN